jgi:hypothetical protein
MVIRRTWPVLALAQLFSSCSAPETEPAAEEAFAPIVLEGEVTLNDRCPVRLAKLNGRIPPLRVNGHPVGFC